VTDDVNDYINDLLVKFLLGETDGAELREVQQWVALSPANERYLADFRRIWEESRHLAIHSTVNEDDAWKNFQRRVGGVAVVREMVIGRQWLRVAAILILVCTGGWLYYNYGYKSSSFIAFYSDSQVVTDTLPDGTIVTLNKQSRVLYEKQPAGNSRRVKLEGEAFFAVAPDKNKPFLVYTRGVLVTVLGTSFNVKATGDATEVIVETGRVAVTSNQHTISLGSHEKALVRENNLAPVKEDNGDDLYNYYRTNEFECNGTPLGRLVEKLNEVYKVHIVFGNERLRALPLTATFRNESPDEILSVITRTFNITLVRNGAEITLK
jgi:ferric-dicitrate binding protein FerR (iron transport regulator)